MPRWSSTFLVALSATSSACWGGTDLAGDASPGMDASAGVDVSAGMTAKEGGASEGGGMLASICSAGCVLNPDEAPPRTECNNAGTKCMGTCGAGCSIQCKGGAECAVTVAAGGIFECDMGSSCEITVDDPAAEVECTNGAHCNITCRAACSYTCKKSATCNVTCGNKPPTMTMVAGTCT